MLTTLDWMIREIQDSRQLLTQRKEKEWSRACSQGQPSGLAAGHNDCCAIHQSQGCPAAQIQPLQKQSFNRTNENDGPNHVFQQYHCILVLQMPGAQASITGGEEWNMLVRDRRQARTALNTPIVGLCKMESPVEANRKSGPTSLSRLNMELGLALL
ncbi:hypothetical protein WISP_91732 [Willisornis vidua]|uniref:Uncharacterized protein n=1 Tax=Willisornis vidua TaxID=1566151 RepID=A0ABQ9D610_9PASS|nr:hypothetical protein WISP_91732 [Willisornis vidua]